jgi:hypothetical protein
MKRMVTLMSNSSRIEAATRSMVGAVLTSKMVVDAVRLAFPDDKSGVYPSDSAYVRTDGILVPRGKVAYGDGVLEYLAANSFKVLADSEIVRMPRKRVAKPAPVAAVETPAAPVVAQEAVAAEPAKKSKSKKNKKKASKAA